MVLENRILSRNHIQTTMKSISFDLKLYKTLYPFVEKCLLIFNSIVILIKTFS